jgi:hypothetical protein
MPNYRRLQIPASTWFFTVNLLQRHNNNLPFYVPNKMRQKLP